MRHNVERLKHFKEKKKNDAHKIPGWVHDPKGKPPSGEKTPWRPEPKRPGPGVRRGHPMPRRSSLVSLEDKLTVGAVGGGLAGSIGGSFLQDHLDKRHRRNGTKAGRLEHALTSVGAPIAGGALGSGPRTLFIVVEASCRTHRDRYSSPPRRCSTSSRATSCSPGWE